MWFCRSTVKVLETDTETAAGSCVSQSRQFQSGMWLIFSSNPEVKISQSKVWEVVCLMVATQQQAQNHAMRRSRDQRRTKRREAETSRRAAVKKMGEAALLAVPSSKSQVGAFSKSELQSHSKNPQMCWRKCPACRCLMWLNFGLCQAVVVQAV